MSASGDKIRLPSAHERQLLLVGGVWLLLLLSLAAYLCSAALPAALAACRQACAENPALTGLMHRLPWIGSGLLLGLIALALGAGVTKAVRQIRRTHRALAALERSARPLPARLRATADGLGLTGALIYVRDPRPLAFCCGFRRPRIVISTGLVRSLGSAELRAVLRHERHHLHRRDPLRLTVMRAVADAFFYLPVVGDLRRRYEVAIELAADEYALLGEPARALAGALLKMARAGRSPLPFAAAGAFDATGLRIVNLTGGGRAPLPSFSRRRLGLSLVLAAALLLGTAGAAHAAGPGPAAGCCTQHVVCPI